MIEKREKPLSDFDDFDFSRFVFFFEVTLCFGLTDGPDHRRPFMNKITIRKLRRRNPFVENNERFSVSLLRRDSDSFITQPKHFDRSRFIWDLSKDSRVFNFQ